MTDQVWPCDRVLCFRQAKWIIVNMPPITDAKLDALGLADADETLFGESATEETSDAVLRILVPAAGRRGGHVEIRFDKHADVSAESIAQNPSRLPVPIEK
jgi:hypothetical protein